jgi:uncharacterized protein
MQIDKAGKYIANLLQSSLPGYLFYHDYHHTLDVVKAAEEIAKDENIRDEDLILLKTAALFHDSGFAHTYNGHEDASCSIAREQLPLFGYDKVQIEKICELIMATKTPQNPQTHLEKILCDADLYYLGSDAFKTNGEKLYKEWKEKGKIQSEVEWNQMQIKFLESHHYFTASAIANREEKKAEHLKELKKSTGN